MADISVHNFVQSLRELMKSRHPNIACEKYKLKSLYEEVFLMSSFLKKIEKKCSFDDEKVNNLVAEIREFVLEAEAIVDQFVMEQRDEHYRQCVLCSNGMSIIHSVYKAVTMCCMEPSLDLRCLQKQIKRVKIGMDLMNVTFDQSTTLVGDVGKMIQKTTKPIERHDEYLEDAVGMDETVEKILAGFDGDQEMEVISVVGLPGTGKTTLAEKVFEHSRTRSSFQVRAWVTVSQTYTTSSKQLLIDILQSSSLYEDSDKDSSEDRLGEDLLKRLKDKKYLIVLDDMWSIEAWNGIKRSFPSNHNGSRVIYTSRFAAIGKDLCRDVNSHNLSGLSEENSWNLLQNKVFGSGDCPPELEGFGREIAKKCDGLPLAIVVIGGILAKKDKTTKQWEQVAESLAPAIATDREAYMDTLALSYHHLPVHLKACFLYLGSIFPEDYEIPVRRLVWLFVAEGFSIQEKNDDQQIQSSEVIAEGYIKELVERSLVTVARKRRCGVTKTVRIHDLLRDFCLVQGKKEKFILMLENFNGYSYSTPLGSKLKGQRRLLLVRDINLDIESFPSYLTSVRSLFLHDFAQSFSQRYTFVKVFAHNFRLLKVLQLDSITLQLLNEIVTLAHVRYLGLGVLPPLLLSRIVFTSSFTKLLYLETLFLRTTQDIDLPDDIWTMVKLRHLYNQKGLFHFKASPSEGANRSSVLPGLQTLHTLCGCKSCLANLVRFPNLKMLGLKRVMISQEFGYDHILPFKYQPILHFGYQPIPDLGFLEQLITLKVSNLRFDYDRPRPLFKLRLPASLKKLTLQDTYLKWEEISVLAELENLEVLKLLENACVGIDANNVWDTSYLKFPKLKYLKMRRLDIVEWDDQNLQCESLEVLILEECQQLESIPFDLAVSPSLHTMEVTRCSNLVEILAKEIEAEHESQCGNSDLQVYIIS